MTRDIIVVTVECARYDHRTELACCRNWSVSKGIAPGHYTRPSLAALHSSQYTAAVQSRPTAPTLAEHLERAGYATAAVSYSPQTTTAFGFADGFQVTHTLDADSGPLRRGSWLRERLGTIGPLRRLRARLQPKASTLASIPRDATSVQHALEWWADTDSPRFLWLHLMGSHRPYGWDDPLADRLDRTAARATPSRLSPTLDTDDRTAVRDAYRRGLRRTAEHITTLQSRATGEPVIVVAGDHGEELGESGYWFHSPPRRRMPESIVSVPVAAHGLDLPPRLSLIDLPPLLCRAAGQSPAAAWSGTATGSDACLTVAPWAGSAALRWSGPSESWRLENATPVLDVGTPARSHDTTSQLRALGYV